MFTITCECGNRKSILRKICKDCRIRLVNITIKNVKRSASIGPIRGDKRYARERIGKDPFRHNTPGGWHDIPTNAWLATSRRECEQMD